MFYHMTTTTWLDQVLSHDIIDVILATGATVGARGDASPCPACGAERRGSDDKRGPVGAYDGCWYCYRCGAKGDAGSWAALAATGSRLDRTNWRAVRDACIAWGLCAPVSVDTARPAPRQWEARTPKLDRDANAPVRRRPPREDLDALWDLALPVTDVSEVAGWLRDARGLDPSVVADLNLARAVAPSGWLPRWASSGGGTWRATGHLLILPLYGAAGGMEAVRARCVRTPAKPAKALSPLGYETAGLVLTDPLARLLLAGEALGDGSSAADEVKRVGLVIAEGDVDWLTWATRWGDAAQDAPAVIGLVAGAWAPEIAARVPDGARVVVRTHDDPAGKKYAAEVAASLMDRCEVLRGGAA